MESPVFNANYYLTYYNDPLAHVWCPRQETSTWYRRTEYEHARHARRLQAPRLGVKIMYG